MKLGEWPHPGDLVNVYPQFEYMVTRGRYGAITALPLQCANLSAAPGLGRQSLVWNGRNAQDRTTAAGVYLVKVQAGTRQATERVVLLR